MFQFVVRVLGGRGEFRQVIFARKESIRFPAVGERLGVQFGVPEHFLETCVVIRAVHRGVKWVSQRG